MNDRDRFLVTYYNPETLARESSGVFGLIDNRFHSKPFIPVVLTDGTVNPEFIDFVFNVQCFYCECDRGSAAFRCENRATKKGNKQYWYAYKKLDGATNRFNIGDLSKLSFETIEEAVAVVCGLKVAQKKSATKKQVAAVGLSQDFKVGDRLTYRAPELPYQFNRGQGVMVEEYEDNIYVDWQDDKHCPHLKTHALKELVKVDDLVELPIAIAGHGKNPNHLQPDLINCYEQLAMAQNEIKHLNMCLQEAQESSKSNGTKHHYANQEIKKLKATLTERDEIIVLMRGEAKDAVERIYELESVLSDKCTYIESLATNKEQIIEYCKALIPTIEKYRSMTTDKTKKANPRYAYLIDFLADIDKIS